MKLLFRLMDMSLVMLED